MQLGKITLKKTAALAPMAGVADRAFREICVQQGACYAVSEMASAKAMQMGSRRTAELLSISPQERPAAAQIFGSEPAAMAQAAVATLAFAPDAIDINMGCPAPKIVGGSSGSALMKNLPLAGKIIQAVSAAVRVPVTVKIRKGWDDASVNAVEAAVLAEQMGAAAITVHGRTRMQMYTPPVDLDIIAAVKRAVSIPVIGNGDVCTLQDAIRMYEYTGCDLVMVGRGALGSPWIFAQINAYFMNGAILPEPDWDEKMALMLSHIKLACRYKGEALAMREARKHVAWYFKGRRGAAELRRRAGQLTRFEQLEELVRISF